MGKFLINIQLEVIYQDRLLYNKGDKMNNLQLRFELQASLQQYIKDIMQQYQIPASMVEDALNKILVNIKEQVWLDYLAEQQQAMYEAQMAAQQQAESSIQEEQEEEVNGELN